MKLNKNNKKGIFLIFFAFLLIISGAGIIGLNLGSIYDGGTGEVQYQEIILDNSGGSALTDYQHEIVVDYNSNMQNDYDDVRFYDGETELKHDKVSYNSNFATFIVQTSIGADTSKTIYMYYGNPDSTDVSDTTIYEIYDGFEDSTILTDGSASTSYVSGKVGQALRLDGSQTYARKTTTTTYTKGYIYETWMKFETPSTTNLGGIVVAGQTLEDDGYYFITDNRNINLPQNMDIHLRKDAGADNVFGDTTRSGDLTANTWYRMKAVWDSDAYLSCYFYEEDGTLFDQYENIIATSYSSGKIGFASYEVNIFDELKVRQCVANPPTITFGTFYNENGEQIYQYDIDNLDVVIPITIDGSASKTVYISKPVGYTSNPNAVYEYYEDGENADEWTAFDSGIISSVANPDGDGNVLYLVGGNPTIASGVLIPLSNMPSLILDCDMRVPTIQGSQLQVNAFQYPYTDRNTMHVQIHTDRDDIAYYTSAWTTIQPYTTYEWKNMKYDLKSTSLYDIYIDDTLMVSDVSTRGTITAYDSIGIITWQDEIGGYVDNIRISQRTANPPTATITDMGSYYKIDITNNEASQLTNYQTTFDGSQLGISSATDSLLIMDVCPISVSSEELGSISEIVETDITLSTTFSDMVQDVKATITKPDTSSELVVLSNTEGNTWTTTLNYNAVGTYTINNFKINTETETIDSSLTFDLTAAPITLSEESLNTSTVQTGNEISLTATFSNTVTDAIATITKPDTSNVTKTLTNSEGNNWTGTLDYTELGNYTIVNYKINSESETLNSTLTFNVVEEEVEEETPVVVPSSGGGGGSSYVPPVEEIANDEPNSSISTVENIIPETTDELGAMNADVLDNPKVLGLFLFVFIILAIYGYALFKKK